MVRSKKLILVADDDVQMVYSVKTLLESSGFGVIFTYRSDKVVELASEHLPDLIILDVMFAGAGIPDGIELSRRINQNPKTSSIPVIILSGVKKVMDFSSDLEPDEDWMPVKAFLDKPIRPETLLNEIKKHLSIENGENNE
ncbi:MAG TPA: response regulator [bacterium]|nr:response regulator [bacterium]HPS29522.1 response regulator [bacterium]